MMTEKEQDAMDKVMSLAYRKGVPEHLCEGLARWYLFGILPGSYLESLLKHDLRGVMDYGDEDSIAGLKATWVFIYNNFPGLVWGSEENMAEWQKHIKEVGVEELSELAGNC